MRPLLLLALLLSPLAPLFAAQSETYAYRTVAMGGGGFVSGLVFHPTEKNLLYARTDVGGAYRWDAGSGAWIALNDDLGQSDSQLLGVLSIALDRNDPDRIYLASGQYLAWWAHTGAILCSKDRGATWTRSDLSIKLGGNSDGRGAGERLQVDPNKGSILFLGSSQDGLWHSTDSGSTWSKVDSFTGSALTFVTFDPRTGTTGSATKTLYAGVDTTTGYALWRSTDAGATWSALPGQPTGLRAYRGVVDANGSLYCTLNDAMGPNGATQGAVWKFNPDTNAWTNITPPTSGQGGFAGISLDASKPGTLMVSTLDRWSAGDEIFRSTDGGATWKGTLLGTTRDYSSAPYAAASSPHWIADVQIDPRDSAHVLFVTGYGLYASSNATVADSGALPVWKFSCKNLEETVPLGLIAPPSGPQLVTVVGDVDGFRHEDTSVSPSWGRLSPQMGTTSSIQYAGQAPATMVRTGSTGQYSIDGGVTWTAFPAKPALPSGAGTVSVSADGARFLWTPTGSGAYYSTDKGVTWTASTGLPSAGSNTYVPIADQVNTKAFYVFNQSSGIVYRSTDGGVSFTAGASGLPSNAGHLHAATGLEGQLWLAIWGKGLYRSTDSGGSFQKVDTVADAYNIGFGKAASGASHPALFLFGKIGTLEGYFRSDDTGTTWIRLNDALHQFGYCNDLTGDPRTFGRFYIATGGRGVIQGDRASLPEVTSQPTSQSAALGSRVELSATVKDATSYQWYHNGSPIAGATASTYVLASFTGADTGSYLLRASNDLGSTSSSTITLGTAAAVSDKIVNISTRASVTGDTPMIAGFAISGTQAKRVLIRAAGPVLRPLGVASALTDPTLTLYSGNTIIASNDDWDSSLDSVASSVGAFPWKAGGKDAAILITLAPGNYTAMVKTKDAPGTALVEVYDADPVPSASWLGNISTRSAVTPDERQIAGFIISGSKARRLLVRAAGPALMKFDVPNTLSNPQFSILNEDTALVLDGNKDWTSSDALNTAFAVTGAFPWTNGSKDAAMLSTLAPGRYSIQVTNTDPSSGTALVEVYDYP